MNFIKELQFKFQGVDIFWNKPMLFLFWRACLSGSIIESCGICCGASVASEQQHIQDLRRIYIKGRRILELSTFYQNALHLTRIHCATFTRVHCATNNSNNNTKISTVACCLPFLFHRNTHLQLCTGHQTLKSD